MSFPAIDSSAALMDWFRRSGVTGPLDACEGPFPATGVSLARWSRRQADGGMKPVSPHPGSYRIAVMLEPLESQIWVGDQAIWGGVIGANRFRICAPGSPGRWRQLSGCDIVNLFVPVQTVERLSQAAGLPEGIGLCDTPFSPDRQVLDLTWKMLDAKASAGALAAQYCDGLATALLCYLLERHGGTHQASAGKGALDGARLRRVLAFIADNITREIPIPEMARHCGMSESHFSRAFHAAAGLPPHQYAMKLRLERACAALTGSEDRMVDIALELGFSSPSHFSRAFAQRYGMPPARYRQLHRRKI
ncbi:helix-turn-helix domain-containing protein [Roseateles sp. DB2]|uniref:helix-turn-helix domain-containing protein n=1 Tax=Roseateles sp. DB2 TaxID=3453717 RepID=UPI003EEE9D13